MAMTESNEGGQNGDSIILSDADGLRTRKVQENGNVHLGRDFAGCEVTIAYRVDSEADEETDDSETDDSDN